MRRLSTTLVAVTVATALVLAAAPAWAERDHGGFRVTHRTVQAGQNVTAYGWGCPGRSGVHINLDDRRVPRTVADHDGGFRSDVTIPARTAAGERRLSARCGSRSFLRIPIHVFHFGSGISVHPRRVQPGETITVRGRGCRNGRGVSIFLNRRLLASATPDERGRFRAHPTIPQNVQRGRSYVVSAFCHTRHRVRFLGAVRIKIRRHYPADHHGQVSADRNAVPAGQTVTLTGDDCQDVAPVAQLDGSPIALAVHQPDKDKGFRATARIPRGTIPGRHRLSASCEEGSAGTTELNVLDPDETATAAATKPFSPTPASDLAIWAGLIAGIALLVASAGVGLRRRRS